ncbi:MAG: hypothetical protein A2252_10555 [Elusimicrobia bacterium RIFOXYA2_FULL_39_19]|nr:MAG: hypothetical protein A2252_10555 [Elusimicrobia bacterium RIFOXYA2_FULL_39_19]
MESNSSLEFVKCNVCGADKTRTIIPTMKNLVKCLNCGLIYRNPRIHQEAWIDSQKQSPYKNTELTFHSAEENIMKHTISRLQKRFKGKSVKLIDIGCGFGAFLNLIKDSGWDISGMDVCKDATDFVKDKLNIPVLCTYITNSGLKDNTFDLVTMFSVIDMLNDPKKQLQDVARILKKDGLLVMRINNGLWHAALSRFNFLLNRIGIYPAVIHLYALRPKDVKKLLELTGYKNIVIENSKFTKGDIYNTGGVFGKYFVILGKFAMYYFSEMVYYFSFKQIALFPTIMAYAQKN